MKHILIDSMSDSDAGPFVRELSEEIADDLVLRGIIHKVAPWVFENAALYEVFPDYSHLEMADLEDLCNGVEVDDGILHPRSRPLHTTQERHSASWIQAARECAKIGDMTGVLRCLDAAEEWPER